MPIIHQADPVKRARLRWRARRGLLENDLILTRFLDAHETGLSDDQVDALCRLLELPDSELMEFLLTSREPTGELDSPTVRELLSSLRAA